MIDDTERGAALSNVINLKDVLDVFDVKNAPIQTKPRTFKECNHKKTEVSKEERRVCCRDCGVELDPFQVLVNLGNAWGWHRLKSIADEVDRLKQLERDLENKAFYALMTDKERELSPLEFQGQHRCDPTDRMWVEGHKIFCYCGKTLSKKHHEGLVNEIERGPSKSLHLASVSLINRHG